MIVKKSSNLDIILISILFLSGKNFVDRFYFLTLICSHKGKMRKGEVDEGIGGRKEWHETFLLIFGK